MTDRIITGLLIPADEAAAWTTVVADDWRATAASVGAQTFEVVYSTFAEEAGLVVIVDEEGRLKGRPVNFAASLLFGRPTGALVGDVIVFGDGGEEFDPIPDEIRDQLLQFRGQVLPPAAEKTS